MAPAAVALELQDVQGLVARGYGSLKAARFVLLAIDDGAAARRWLGGLLDAVTAGDDRPAETALNVALTSSGLERLGLAPAVLELFAQEFVAGMTTPHRRRILGDVDENAPERWDWGGPGGEPVHAVLLLYAAGATQLARLAEEQSRALAAGGVRVVHELGTSDLDGFEPFGFRDGISQPLVEGLSKAGPPGFTVRAGEFVLGYPNEYGRLADRPTVEGVDLGRNGSYLVFRQLKQDVRAFWRFLDGATRNEDGSADPEARVRLASKMVGRWPSGAPLVLAPDRDDPALAEAAEFGYHDDDRSGERCPIGSHIRRANPRDSLDPRPGSDRSLAVNRRHRILRRGREYGSSLTPEEALLDPRGDDEERGLHFICLNANIARQFEFVQHTWVNDPKFAGLYDDADPLVAPSQPYGGTFTVQAAGVRQRVTDLPRFVSVKGGAYFFLPGIAALRAIASLDG